MTNSPEEPQEPEPHLSSETVEQDLHRLIPRENVDHLGRRPWQSRGQTIQNVFRDVCGHESLTTLKRLPQEGSLTIGVFPQEVEMILGVGTGRPYDRLDAFEGVLAQRA